MIEEQIEKRVTLEREGISEVEEKKSVFIGRAMPVETEEEALAYIKEIKSRFADARHNVWGYRLQGDVVMRCSDDGEPQGSAGVPVLDVLRKAGVSNAVIVVTRYFGGILLGAGGLVRMYSRAAKEAVDQAHIIVKEKCTVWSAVCSYADHPRLLAELPKFGATVEGTEFADAVTLRFTVPAAAEKGLLSRIREMSGGSIVPGKVGEIFRATV